METIQINVPTGIGQLLENDKKLMIRATRHVIKERLWELKNRLEESQVKINEFRKKYGIDFNEFEKNITKGELSGASHHEDYNEWFFWENVSERVIIIDKK